MDTKLQVIPSGNPLVDLTWGGFLREVSIFFWVPENLEEQSLHSNTFWKQ